MRYLGMGLSFAALLGVAGATTGRTPTICTVAYVPYFHSDDMTYVLATALEGTVTDRTDSVAVSSTRRALLPIRSRGTVEGQLLQVQAARGVGADSISTRLAGGDSVAVLIRWGLGSDCSAIPVGPSIPAGEVDHFIVALRPSAAWVQGHPTFEGGPSSYFGIYPGRLRSQLAPNVALLSPVEFSSFVDALPTDTAWQTDCRGAMTRLKQWTTGHRALSAKYPVPDALRDLGGICDKRRS
jgi:hypothetical protein